eukprot:g1607.t1
MYDVISPKLLSSCVPSKRCADWSKAANETVRNWFGDVESVDEAKNYCAQLAKSPGLTKPSPVLDPAGIGGQGAWCLCEASDETDWAYCESPKNIPEQINLQIASKSGVVVSFVTFEDEKPSEAPFAEIQEKERTAEVSFSSPSSSSSLLLRGVTHIYVSPSGSRTYWMHFVTFEGLKSNSTYTYRVKSGGQSAEWSSNFTFRAPPAVGTPTTVDIFGDMGVYTWNNMQNMLSDSQAGDAYMQAYEKILTRTPWIPVVGNHEFYDGDALRRYLNQTEGTVVADQTTERVVGWSTATSALGRLLSTANHHGAGLYGAGVPSNTSRYYSVDVGLIHFVALDLNMYNGVDNCGEPCRQAQLAWLDKDLALANENRDRVPWIVAMSHFPLYCSNCPAPGHEPDALGTPHSKAAVSPPGDWWNEEYCEYVGHDASCVVPPSFLEEEGGGVTSTTAGNDDMVPDFEPLFMKYGVDVYASGHIHDYEWIYPIWNATAVQKDFVDPRAPVHLVTGNGGPPSASSFSTIKDYAYAYSTKDIGVYPAGLGSYTRMTAFNSSTMRWTQIANNDSSVLEDLFITRTTAHGPFPVPGSLGQRGGTR